MPRPIEQGRRYVPGLDGIRALAVISVIAYHLGLPWAKGGMLGVGVFFTLSGYLITDLLLGHWRRHGGLGLGTFWLRRARRLLPALFLMLATVSVWVALFDASQLDQVRRQVISSAFYFANWSTIAQHGSYFARFATPLPLDHLWSLSIEEQFYLVWPWLLLLTIRCWGTRRALLWMTLGLAAASMVAMGLEFHPGYDPTRAYEGTDTRAFTLLIGAALAIVWPSRLPNRAAVNPRLPILLDGFAVLGIVAIVVLIWQTDAFTSFLYPYGFLILSLATAAVVAAVVHPREPGRRRARREAAALDRRPLVRDLPVAVADHRARDPRRRDAGVGARHARGRGHGRDRQPVVALRRGADPPRRDRPAVAPAAERGRPDRARSRARWRCRRRY